MRMWMMLATVGLSALAARAEGPCFSTVAEAAQQSGALDLAGFRRVEAHQDAFSGASWSTVVSCAHPERPAVAVRGVAVRGVAGDSLVVAGPALVMAGSEVKLVREEAAMRMELTGTAMGNGAVGARVRVRVRGLVEGAEDRFVAGIVRADGALEMEE